MESKRKGRKRINVDYLIIGGLRGRMSVHHCVHFLMQNIVGMVSGVFESLEST